MRPSSEGYPLHTGWYLDLFPGEEPAMSSESFVADWYASANSSRVSYLGVRGARLSLFVVDRGGSPRLMVGPVPQSYEYAGPLARRLSDEGVGEVPEAELRAPWETSYTVVPVPPPEMSITTADVDRNGTAIPREIARRLTVRTAREQGTLSVEFLDARRRLVAHEESAVGPQPTTLTARWLPAVLRAHPRVDGEGAELRVSVWGRRLRMGEWVDVELEHPRPGRECDDSMSFSVDLDTFPLREAPAP